TWPALASRQAATVGSGADQALLSETTRTEGTRQATYNNWPLYYYVGDVGPGDVDGQGVDDAWFVVGADGKLIKTNPLPVLHPSWWSATGPGRRIPGTLGKRNGSLGRPGCTYQHSPVRPLVSAARKASTTVDGSNSGTSASVSIGRSLSMIAVSAKPGH